MTAVIATPPSLSGHVEGMEVVGRRWRTGVLLLILADAAFVAALLFSYLYLRGLNTEDAWTAKGASIAAIWVGWALAGGLLLAAGAAWWAEVAIRGADRRRLVAAEGLGVLVVLACSVGQVLQLASFPFRMDSSSYASMTVLIAGANLFHLLLTLFIGLGLWNRARLGRFTSEEHWQVQLGRIWFVWVALASVATALATSFVASPHVA
ncbi:MAG: hypothetical protein WCD35_13955 [Mycobacteriales bacterium]